MEGKDFFIVCSMFLISACQQVVGNLIKPTYSVCLIQFKTAEDLVDVSGMEKSISPHHHLKTL